MDYVEPPSLKLEVYYEKYYEDVYECECCGPCFPEGERVYFNGKEIWEKYSDGHMYARQSGELLDALINGLLAEIKEQGLGEDYAECFEKFCVYSTNEYSLIEGTDFCSFLSESSDGCQF